MARIRTIKPEFWRSPSTASVGPWGRLLYIAMWNWADDHGRAEWTPRELLGFAFPHDSESPCTEADFPRLLAEVRDAFEVKFYTHRGRRFYEIPAWSEHQKTEKRAGDKFPHADDLESMPDQGIPGSVGASAGIGGISETSGGNGSAGTGEQGNRGTEEQGNSSSSEIANATPRHEVQSLLDLLDSEIQSNGGKPSGHVKRNQDAMRLLIDKDGRTPEQIAACIRWCQADEFWRSNILSASKLRDKYDQLRLKASAQRTQSRMSENAGVVYELEQELQRRAIG